MDSYVCWPGQTAKVAPLGFGCCPMGGHGWGKTEEKQLVDAVSAALDLGVTFFDTADIYGLGTSESVLGAALQNKREKAFIATKFGVRFENGRSFHDTSIRWINQALEDSLRRLRTDWIDLYQMHYWDGATALEEIEARISAQVRPQRCSVPPWLLLWAADDLPSGRALFSVAADHRPCTAPSSSLRCAPSSPYDR